MTAAVCSFVQAIVVAKQRAQLRKNGNEESDGVSKS